MDTNRTPETPQNPQDPQNPQTPGQPDQTAVFETAPPASAAAQPPAGQPVATPAAVPAPAAPGATPPTVKTAAWRRKPVWVAAAVVALMAGGAGVAYAVDELGDDDDDSSWSMSDERRADDLDRDDRSDDYRSGDDRRDSRGSDDRSGEDQSDDRTDADDVPLTDAEITSATDAALAEAGSGTVTDVDRSDDADHAFEVDVLLDGGDELEVELADDFTVVRTELDPADKD